MSAGFVELDGHRVEYAVIGGSGREAPLLVFLHEGLGSVAMWRDFPQRVAAATGCPALVYSRYGYGSSAPLAGPRRPDYLHDEALRALPQLLDALGARRPLLIGHSDGASIALIHAGGAGRPVAGVVAMAPHVMVEDIALDGIRATVAAYETTDLRQRLARYHDDADGAFRGWSGIWLDPAFRGWNIEEYLPRIAAPVLAIQGFEDEYATMEQIDRIARLAPDADLLKLADCRHSPHRDQPDAVVSAIAAFVARIA
ncbi:MAG TPA: alpha/beta hydrolase [Rhodocyclaceae bacterium]